MAKTIYVLNGPNLNLLGTREPETYGHHTLADVEKLCRDTAARFGMTADCRQSNREGELIDFIHEAGAKKAAGIIINAGGYSHTSIALHDALVDPLSQMPRRELIALGSIAFQRHVDRDDVVIVTLQQVVDIGARQHVVGRSGDIVERLVR